MKILLRKLSLILMLALIAPIFACTAQKTPGDTTGVPGTDTTAGAADAPPVIEYEPDGLPSTLDFEGQTITFLTADGDWFKDEISVEELKTDIINDSIYNRERFVEDRLGVEIKNHAEDENYLQTVTTQFNAGEDSYQIYAQKALRLSEYIFLGYLKDLYEVNYLELDRPWWSQRFSEEAQMLDHLYLATGSLSLSLKRFLFAVFYNKKLAQDYSGSFPELTELYNIVERGDWTYDLFYRLGSGIYTDLNGNSEADEEDLYGVGYNGGISIDVLWSSFDVQILSKDEDNWFRMDLNAEKCYDAMDKISTLLNKTKGCYSPGVWDEDLVKLEKKLAEDSLLFMVNRLYAAEQETLRDMQSDYGVLPFPKYDAQQAEYLSYAHDQYMAFGIPATVLDADCAGAVLEAMASYSYRETEPAYLDLALKGQYMNDPESRKMIDLVVDGFKVDAAWIYLYTLGLSFTNECRLLVSTGDTSYASTYAKYSRKLERMLGVYRQEFEKMTEK